MTLALLLDRVGGQGFVAGVDPSAEMLGVAAARNVEAARMGRLELHEGTVSALPFADGRFDAVLTVNTFYFWATPAADLRELRRVLRPAGRLVVAFRVQHSADPDLLGVRWQGRTYALPTVTDAFARAGFRDLRLRVRPLHLYTAAAISARA